MHHIVMHLSHSLRWRFLNLLWVFPSTNYCLFIFPFSTPYCTRWIKIGLPVIIQTKTQRTLSRRKKDSKEQTFPLLLKSAATLVTTPVPCWLLTLHLIREVELGWWKTSFQGSDVMQKQQISAEHKVGLECAEPMWDEEHEESRVHEEHFGLR